MDCGTVISSGVRRHKPPPRRSARIPTAFMGSFIVPLVLIPACFALVSGPGNLVKLDPVAADFPGGGFGGAPVADDFIAFLGFKQFGEPVARGFDGCRSVLLRPGQLFEARLGSGHEGREGDHRLRLGPARDFCFVQARGFERGDLGRDTIQNVLQIGQHPALVVDQGFLQFDECAEAFQAG